jgi:hypothetical protein
MAQLPVVHAHVITSGHVTSGSHATSGHAQWYIVTTTIERKKHGKNSHFRACTEHTSGQGRFSDFWSRMHNGPIPPDDTPEI